MVPEQPVPTNSNTPRPSTQATEVHIVHESPQRPQLSTSQPVAARPVAPITQPVVQAAPVTPKPQPVAKSPILATISADAMTSSEAEGIQLPLAVVSRTDVSKCLRELESVEDFFHQSALRGVQPKDLPTVGRVLDSLAKSNSMSLLKAEDRVKLMQFLARLKVKAPVVHISFPVEASGDFIAQLLEWFRKEIHPHVVLQIGLQPELAAGCVLRTNSKYFDFSFRKHFERSKEKLVAALEASE